MPADRIVGEPLRSVIPVLCATGKVPLNEAKKAVDVPFAFSSLLSGVAGFVMLLRDVQTFGDRTPFFVSANEVRFAREAGDRFRVYRLFDFKAMPRLFELDGPIERHCRLDPTTFRASFG